MNIKNTLLIVLVAAVAGFGAGYFIYNQNKEEPKVVKETSSGAGGVSQVEVANDIATITQQSPALFPTLISEGRSLNKNDLPTLVKELLPTISNLPVKEVTFDPEQTGFQISYVANENLEGSHQTLLSRVRNSSTEWDEIYAGRGAWGAIIDISNDVYQVRIVQEALGETTSKVSLLVVEL